MANRGSYDITSFLLSSGAQINAVDNEGQTPLMLAVICEHEDIIRLLLDSGADVNILNSEGQTVLSLDGTSELIASLLVTSKSNNDSL